MPEGRGNHSTPSGVRGESGHCRPVALLCASPSANPAGRPSTGGRRSMRQLLNSGATSGTTRALPDRLRAGARWALVIAALVTLLGSAFGAAQSAHAAKPAQRDKQQQKKNKHNAAKKNKRQTAAARCKKKAKKVKGKRHRARMFA